uniref:Uncharacterized protein AlNc14C149G7475 n=1 Tax=Albugo laibachii Nc14 TaxID=890382 RepID=F0WLW2_9STRA|nr:conserved hypothetical protein [Albugo laibachii Nc14]|eukprot:CCA22288.1 conserved hypothetical protein [Albugo laibachii Nc14]
MKSEKQKQKRKDAQSNDRRTKKQKKSSKRQREPDFQKAVSVIRELLLEYPQLLSDLVKILQLLDDGKAAITSGIKNKSIRSQLKKLLPLLGVQKMENVRGAYIKLESMRGTELVTSIQSLLLKGSSETQTVTVTSEPTVTPEKDKKAANFVGPLLPPTGLPAPTLANEAESEEEIIGPSLPGTKGFRNPDSRTEKRMKKMEQRLAKSNEQTSAVKREEWMTTMPENSILKSTFAPNEATRGKPATFRKKDPAPVDRTWFDDPQERDRMNRAKMDIELFGYVRPENDTGAQTASSEVLSSTIKIGGHREDESSKQQMDMLQLRRGPSLLEQHQKAVAEKHPNSSNKASKRWNRERDLVDGRRLNRKQAEEIIDASKGISAKFTSPTIARQFL